MCGKHRMKKLHKSKKTNCIDEEFNKTALALLLVLIIHIKLKKELSLQDLNKEHNKKYKVTHKTCTETVTSQIIPLNENTSETPLVIKKEPLSHMFNNKHNEECSNKDHKVTHKTCTETVTSQTIPLNENTSKTPLVHNKEPSSHIFNSKHNEDCSNKEHKVIHKISVANVVSQTIPLCDNIPKTPLVIQKPVIIKVPIVLAEPQVTIPILSSVILKDSTPEIKSIKKNVYLTQCNLLPNSEILFISGFIKNSLEYANTECIEETELKGTLKHSTFKIPFNCTTKIKFITNPIFTNNVSEQEIELLNSHIKVTDSCEENTSGHDPYEKSFKSTESFNEKIFCELVSAETIETETIQNTMDEHFDISTEPFCFNITERFVLYLTIKILQNQQILIC